MTEVDRSPSAFGRALALVAGVLALAAAALGAVLAIPLGALGLLALAVGVTRSARTWVSVGAGGLFLGVAVAGVEGAPPEPLLVGAVGAVVAYDAGTNAVEVGRQLGRAASTGRAEAVHAAASLLVGALAVAVGYGVYRAATGGQPVTALALLLLGVVALVSALR